MIEHERSYIFTHESANNFLDGLGMKDLTRTDDCLIDDYYLGKGFRVRRSERDDHTKYVLTKKQGEKSAGYRLESEEEISPRAAEMLTADPILHVHKLRKVLPVSDDHYQITMDFIEAPMELAVLEIEGLDEVVYPLSEDIASKLLNVDLIECPLCTHGMFKRRIGICGGPSSGKSETAKGLSHTLNTTFQANSFAVAEFATTFIQKYHKNPNFWEEFFIWHGQHEREDNAGTADIVISDCPTFLAYIYLLHLPKDKFSTDTALVLAKIYKRVLFDIQLYSDIIFLKLIEYKDNNVRYQTSAEAFDLERRIKGFLDDHHIPYHTYNYTESERILKDLFYLNL